MFICPRNNCIVVMLYTEAIKIFKKVLSFALTNLKLSNYINSFYSEIIFTLIYYVIHSLIDLSY